MPGGTASPPAFRRIIPAPNVRAGRLTGSHAWKDASGSRRRLRLVQAIEPALMVPCHWIFIITVPILIRPHRTDGHPIDPVRWRSQDVGSATPPLNFMCILPLESRLRELILATSCAAQLPFRIPSGGRMAKGRDRHIRHHSGFEGSFECSNGCGWLNLIPCRQTRWSLDMR